ncbi:UDP-N-acetylmuramoyl-L-alanyl-D-glutamate--2,6-diaminopimelate ligase [Paenisporosarcina cavernae]|uniref:UDP-N-acetylmuramyl-tripeptide synthetase n=1 Tax=Paenisporosarcina cavernae TaxID=2320858 RepID=A0A385YST9_9BACL|nr:UDP-N-acetylmuramoyl-L-alanyl-D-glutamate--2,6-diaminopimelate ligase [Paenisporosarcina cavernae]AYC29047.1 UDP-N-acetylmuramoyl-L-alanyl-D-glutamate--2,6-diaminopimelate ligase [Paenisporosarcina cavernae]
MQTADLLNSIVYKKIIGTLPTTISDVAIDSRSVQFGSMFICIKGYTADGHDFIPQAIDAGAKVIVIDQDLEFYDDRIAYVFVSNTTRAAGLVAAKFFDYPSKKMTLYGVTGTNGKTSVSGMIYHLLRKFEHKTALTGTIGFTLNDVLYDSMNTTNDVLTTQQMIHQAVSERCSDMIMEVSSHGLSLGRLTGVEFDVAIFTNLTHDHLDFHGTMEQYGHAKSLLFSQLGQDLTQDKHAVLNVDDAWSERLMEVTPFPVWTYGLENKADFQAIDIQLLPDKTTFTMVTPFGSFPIEMKLLGKFNVYNALASIAALSAKGYPIEELVLYLQQLHPVKGRMERLETGYPISIYIDYAHTPDAIEKAIDAIRPTMTAGKLIFVIGTGGNRDRTKRPIMAEKASKADYVILTTDDPRFESYDTILDELKSGMVHPHFACIGDRKEAVYHAVEIADVGDTIIFAGKGHEDYQIIGNEKTPHSDGDLALEALAQKFAMKH